MDSFLPGGNGTAAALAQLGWGSASPMRAPGEALVSPPAYQGLEVPGPMVAMRAPGEAFWPTAATRAPGEGAGLGTPEEMSPRAPGEGTFSTPASSAGYWEAQLEAFAPPPPPNSGVGGAIGAGANAFGGFFGGGSGTTVGGEWTGVEKWSDQINAAASKYGVPVNLIKSIMRLESGGDPGSRSDQGAQGLMQIMPFWNGTAGYNIYDPNQNVMLGAYILKESHDRWAARGAANPWEEAARDYIGRGSADSYGTDQHSYWARIQQYWNELNSYGSGGSGSGSSGGTATIQSMFGSGAQLHGWGEFGTASDLDYYGYGRQYGLNGFQHTGIDVAMDVGTPMRAAFNGTVVCAGTGNGNGMDSCAAFNDYYGNRAGRVQIMSADGNTMLIYGHSSTSAVRPGQQVRAGDLLGTSGGMNSPHIHLEARVKDPSMPSGWRIVDPRQVLGGGGNFGAGGAGANAFASGGSSPAPAQSFTEWFLQQARNR